MKIGFIGLGRMGYNMVLNLLEHGNEVVVLNRSPESVKKIAKKGAIASYSVSELVEKIPGRKVIWLMVPAGKPVDDLIGELAKELKKGDVIIDGGNSYFKDSIKRGQKLKRKEIHFLDCGTSGGMEGARKGACMMVGGEKKVFDSVEKLFRDMCVKKGYGYMGASGSGHYVKMVHNGIEYGMMGAIGEGLQNIERRGEIDMNEVIKVYSHGSIIESRLMSWLFEAFNEKNYLSGISGKVPKGETEKEMEELEKRGDMKILHQARLMRVNSRKKGSYSGKLISAMRNKFGGHKVNKK